MRFSAELLTLMSLLRHGTFADAVQHAVMHFPLATHTDLHRLRGLIMRGDLDRLQAVAPVQAAAADGGDDEDPDIYGGTCASWHCGDDAWWFNRYGWYGPEAMWLRCGPLGLGCSL